MLSVLCLVTGLLPYSCIILASNDCATSFLIGGIMIALTGWNLCQEYRQNYQTALFQSNTLEAGGNATTYLEGFIEALKTSKESKEQKVLVANLRAMQTYGESCTGWTKHREAVEENDFFKNLENFLRFLGHNALLEETN
uniref:Uncharacterized protein n=1 Tax=Malurus cyaneus samueli TaxID=2593467 RepID=A0A8C5U3I2_9PASS